MTDIEIRPFEERDRGPLIGLARELQAAEAALFDRMKAPDVLDDWYAAYLLDACRRSKGEILVATDDENVVGYVVVLTAVSSEGEVDEIDYRYALIQDIAVTERCRGRGIGARLLARAEALAREAGARWLRLYVFSDNAAAWRAYDKAGFKPLITTMEKPLDG